MRVLARWGVLLVAAGAAAVAAADARAGLSGFVSESATAAAPAPGAYRAGLWTAALGIALLGVAARGAATGRYRLLPAAALGAAVPAAVTSGAVTCTPGCPLPPYEPTTGADLVHAAASIGALAVLALALLALAVAGADPRVRRRSRVGCAVALPLLAAAAVSLLVAGRATPTGVLERAALAALLAWLLAVGPHLGTRPARPLPGPARPPQLTVRG